MADICTENDGECDGEKWDDWKHCYRATVRTIVVFIVVNGDTVTRTRKYANYYVNMQKEIPLLWYALVFGKAFIFSASK